MAHTADVMELEEWVPLTIQLHVAILSSMHVVRKARQYRKNSSIGVTRIILKQNSTPSRTPGRGGWGVHIDKCITCNKIVITSDNKNFILFLASAYGE